MLKYLTNMSPVILLVLGLLCFFSVVSWAIILYKLVQIGRAKKCTRIFLDLFWGTRELASVSERLGDYKGCPLAAVFESGYRESTHFLRSVAEAGQGENAAIEDSAIDSVTRSLRKSSSQEVDRLERNLGFLATTGSTTPFIGLFGTVWGIMIAFRNIGLTGSTSLDIVAPGISEALVTTAIGLAVAIPAVIGYNYLQGKIKVQVSEIDNFSMDFLNRVQKTFMAKK